MEKLKMSYNFQSSGDYQALYNGIKSKSFEDRAFGCIIGAFIGDSCGSYLEFEREIID